MRRYTMKQQPRTLTDTAAESMPASARPVIWRMSGRAEAPRAGDFEAALLAIAAHDLRQPLQAIRSAHELLGVGLRTNSERHLLKIGESAIDRLAQQLNALLCSLRLRECTENVTLSRICVETQLRQACLESQDSAARKGITIRMVATRASIMSDAVLFGSILGNLVSNAVRYTRPGGRILLGCRSAGTAVRIDVIDTGIGIGDEQMPRIFDAFSRVHSTHSDGLGIGLFIVRRAVAVLRHGIDVHSVTDRGTRFSIIATRAE